MHLRLIDYVFWFSAPSLQVVILISLFKRGLHREYPCFCNYTILQVVSVPVLYVMHLASYAAYYYAYSVNLALSLLLSFAVLQEIFRDAFRPYEALRDLSVILFRWSALVVLLVSVMWAITPVGHPSDHSQTLFDAILLGERSLRLMQCGLVFFLLLFSEYLGIPRRSLLFGITIGFGFFAAISMLLLTAASHPGILGRAMISRINSGAYLLSVVNWLGYSLLAPSRSGARRARSQNWNFALEDARVAAGADSLLDTMDRTVERLLYPPDESKAGVVIETRP